MKKRTAWELAKAADAIDDEVVLRAMAMVKARLMVRAKESARRVFAERPYKL